MSEYRNRNDPIFYLSSFLDYMNTNHQREYNRPEAQINQRNERNERNVLFNTFTSLVQFGLRSYLNSYNQSENVEEKDKRFTILTVDEIEPGSVISETTCSICCEDFYKENDKIATTMCHHSYHFECITEWLKKSENCPLCRSAIHLPEDE